MSFSIASTMDSLHLSGPGDIDFLQSSASVAAASSFARTSLCHTGTMCFNASSFSSMTTLRRFVAIGVLSRAQILLTLVYFSL